MPNSTRVLGTALVFIGAVVTLLSSLRWLQARNVAGWPRIRAVIVTQQFDSWLTEDGGFSTRSFIVHRYDVAGQSHEGKAVFEKTFSTEAEAEREKTRRDPGRTIQIAYHPERPEVSMIPGVVASHAYEGLGLGVALIVCGLAFIFG